MALNGTPGAFAYILLISINNYCIILSMIKKNNEKVLLDFIVYYFNCILIDNSHMDNKKSHFLTNIIAGLGSTSDLVCKQNLLF